jgi:hypothetical protein
MSVLLFTTCIRFLLLFAGWRCQKVALCHGLSCELARSQRPRFQCCTSGPIVLGLPLNNSLSFAKALIQSTECSTCIHNLRLNSQLQSDKSAGVLRCLLQGRGLLPCSHARGGSVADKLGKMAIPSASGGADFSKKASRSELRSGGLCFAELAFRS